MHKSKNILFLKGKNIEKIANNPHVFSNNLYNVGDWKKKPLSLLT